MSTQQRVIVTGGGDSVGRVVAEMLLRQGALVHICDVRREALEDTIGANPGMHGTVANVGRPAEVELLFTEAKAWMGGLTGLVNNVGVVGPTAALEDIDYAAWDETISVNLSGMFYTMKHAIPLMKQQGFGSIVNISTSSTRTRLPHRAPYVVSKFGVEGLTLNAARELGPFNIRCNAILPGMINNKRMRGILEARARATNRSVAQIEQEYTQYISMRTKIEPEEIATVILFLLSDQARHVTGELISVSGNVEWEI